MRRHAGDDSRSHAAAGGRPWRRAAASGAAGQRRPFSLTSNNIALGDRRAGIVKQYLIDLGVPASRIEVRSLGTESPFCQADGEACWSQNRRGHFVITRK